MGTSLTLTAADGHRLTAYRAEPSGPSLGRLVVIQEIFGLNSHIRDVTDGFARDGYVAVAPALFDRVERGVELGYDGAAVARGRAIRAKIPWDQAMADIAAAAVAAGGGPFGVVGYCWGGTVAWAAASRLNLGCAVAYYGTGIFELRNETPRCPTLLHFGANDASIPPANIEAIRAAQPAVESHVYAGADHGFSCDRRGSFQREAAKLARDRTLAFFARHLGRAA